MTDKVQVSSRKNTLFSLLLTVFCLVIGLAIGEGVLRLKNMSMQNYDIEMWRYARELKVRSADPKLGHEHIPSSEALLQSVTIRTNAQGLRGPELRDPAPARRILFLGASITLGWGVPEEQVLTSIIHEKFKAKGQDVEVLNAGIGNYNAERYTQLYFTRLEALKPTDIVVHYFLRDAEQLDPGGGNFFLRNSELAVTMWIALNRLFGEKGENVIENHYKSVYGPATAGYQQMQASLKRLSQHAKANNIRLTIAMVPDVHNLENYKLGWIHEQMKKEAASLDVPFVDLLPAFGTLSPKDVWAMPGDPHPNAKGHQLMADALFPVLEAAR
jgi:lysophospholipase L1-like esterase